MNLHDLYNGYNAVAERVDQDALEDIHITTPLDKQIHDWIQAGKDVILTGNPGDGKTHLIAMLSHQGLLDPAYPERDASQKTASEILATWMHKKQVGIPFVLAVNHAPLRELAQVALEEQYQPLQALRSIPDAIDSLIFYNEEPDEPILSDMMVVDLSHRSLLDPLIIRDLIQKLHLYATGSQCKHCPPNRCLIESNAAALSQEKIRTNILELLNLVNRRGFHITMRDLIGLFAYIIVGDAPCITRWQKVDEDEDTPQPGFEDYAYYNLLFTGRSPLFDAIRNTFDPALYPDTETDMLLWQGEVTEDWLMRDPPLKQPSTLAELQKLKRRYFFEHDHNTNEYLNRVMEQTDRSFDRLVKGDCSDQEQVENLVAMINTLYAPIRKPEDHSYRLRLRLWNNHRYSVGTLPGYVAMRSLAADKLCIYRPKPVSHLSSVFSIHKDHVLLGVQAYRPGDPSLRIDWTMYQVFVAAKAGKPVDFQPFHILRRLDLFLRSLGGDALGTREVETVEWSDHRRRQLAQVRVNRATRSYEKRG